MSTVALDAVCPCGSSEWQALHGCCRQLAGRLSKLQTVLQIAGDSTHSIEEVEERLSAEVSKLAVENQRLHAITVRQRRQALVNTFEKFDVDMEG